MITAKIHVYQYTNDSDVGGVVVKATRQWEAQDTGELCTWVEHFVFEDRGEDYAQRLLQCIANKLDLEVKVTVKGSAE